MLRPPALEMLCSHQAIFRFQNCIKYYAKYSSLSFNGMQTLAKKVHFSRFM